MDPAELELLLAPDGSEFEMTPDVIVEFTARRTDVTPERPHGVSHALVLRFDNAHAAGEPRRGDRRPRAAYDHRHRTEKDKGRAYQFTTATRLLDDFWREVKRVLDEKGIPNDL